jgi:hypothetical protein
MRSGSVENDINVYAKYGLNRSINVASMQVLTHRKRVLDPCWCPAWSERIILLKPPRWYFEGICQIWFESVHKCVFYTGFDPPETGFGHLLVPRSMIFLLISADPFR